MKHKLICLLSAITLLLCMGILLSPAQVHAQNLDEIEKYDITIDVNKDASLNINYHIEWRVLDRIPKDHWNG